MRINKDILTFVEEAKDFFENEKEQPRVTYRDEDKGYIALRYNDNSIQVFKLGEEIGFFDDWIEANIDQNTLKYYIKQISKYSSNLNDKLIDKLKNIVNEYKIHKKEIINNKRILIVQKAYEYSKLSYIWGKSSNFVRYIYNQLGIYISESIQEQAKQGIAVNKNELQPGDLIFFGDSSIPNCVGIYIGNGQYIDDIGLRAINKSKISNMNVKNGYVEVTRNDYIGARRIIY